MGRKVMRIVRFIKDGEIFFGKISGNEIYYIQGNIFDQFEVTTRKVNVKSVKILSPVFPPNIIAIGKNYKDHVKETNSSLPKKPLIFLKATSSIIGNEDEIILPEAAPNEVDFEAELAIVIGREAKFIEEKKADDYILGYTCANDVSARDCQKRLDKQWARAKSFDTFCPIGPWIETQLIQPNNLKITSKLNGNIMQDSNTNKLIFNTRELVSYCSKNFTLLPGTIIMTGTPGGVGYGREPKVFLKPGDKIEIEIEGIGKLYNKVQE